MLLLERGIEVGKKFLFGTPLTEEETNRRQMEKIRQRSELLEPFGLLAEHREAYYALTFLGRELAARRENVYKNVRDRLAKEEPGKVLASDGDIQTALDGLLERRLIGVNEQRDIYVYTIEPRGRQYCTALRLLNECD